MAKPEWGAKHLCENCGLKYYDMQRNPIACPSCGEKVTVVAVRSRRSRTAVKAEPEAPKNKDTAVAAAEAGVAPDDGDADDDADDDKLAAKEVAGGSVATDAKES